MHNKEYIIKVSNDFLYHTKYEIDLNSQKLLMLLIYKKKKELINDCDLYENNGSFNSEELHEILESIISEPIEVGLHDLKKLFGNNKISFNQIIEKFKKTANTLCKFNASGQITKIIFINKEIEIDEINKSLKFKLNYALKDYILTIFKNYSEVDIDIFLKLSSKYQVRLYEYLCLYNYSNTNKEKRKRAIEYIASFFDVPKTYQMRDINKWVFEPSLKALNKIYAIQNKKINIKYFKLNKDRPKKITHLRIDIEDI